MDILFMVLCATVVIGFLVFIHEGGHYLAARAFGVRVTEFMLGLPGPSVGFTRGGTRFGVTAGPLGGYAKVCGMEAGEMKPHLKEVLASLYERGTAEMETVALDCGITDDEAFEALEELVEWGSVVAPTKKDQTNTYRAPASYPVRRRRRRGPTVADDCAQARYALGEPRPVPDAAALFESEYCQQYRAQPFWKRSVILLAGIAVNLLFAMVAFIVIFSVIGMDLQLESGEVVHRTMSPLQSVQAGFVYIGMVVQAVAGLFNPATAAQTVSDSTSIVGIAVMSKTYFEAGVVAALQFMARISVSLGVMNLLPIPPLDGGRFVVEVFQKLTRRLVSTRAMTYLSMAGMALFIGFFVIMLNQDVQRFILGNW